MFYKVPCSMHGALHQHAAACAQESIVCLPEQFSLRHFHAPGAGQQNRAEVLYQN
jgi:hypothetical protein